MVLCNLSIRKAIYTLENSCYEGSGLSYGSVLVFHMYFCFYLFSSVCIWSSMFVFRTICKCSSNIFDSYFVVVSDIMLYSEFFSSISHLLSSTLSHVLSVEIAFLDHLLHMEVGR